MSFRKCIYGSIWDKITVVTEKYVYQRILKISPILLRELFISLNKEYFMIILDSHDIVTFHLTTRIEPLKSMCNLLYFENSKFFPRNFLKNYGPNARDILTVSRNLIFQYFFS